MAAFLPLKAGGWAFGEVLTSGQMNQLNTDFPFAPNCRDGGTYTTSGDLTINGLAIRLADVLISCDVFTTGLLQVGTTVFAQGGAFVGAVAAGSFTTAGSITASGNIVANNAGFSGQMAASTIIGKQVNADLIGVDADHTYLMTSTDAVYTNSLTAGRNWTIDTTGASDGMRIAFTSNDGTHTVTLIGPFAGGGTIALLASGGRKQIVFTLLGGLLYILH